MKLSSSILVEFKTSNNIAFASYSMNNQFQMIVPGASSCCTLGSCSSCSCGATSKS